jgi:excisionase family DNA binding protein
MTATRARTKATSTAGAGPPSGGRKAHPLQTFPGLKARTEPMLLPEAHTIVSRIGDPDDEALGCGRRKLFNRALSPVELEATARGWHMLTTLKAEPDLTAVLKAVRAQRVTAAPGLPGLLRAEEAARHLGVSRATFYRTIRPSLPRVETGGPVRFRREDLERWAVSRVRVP